MNYAVIMAGGSGTRLWPLSREKCPKQALTLVGERTMFQQAVDRLAPLFPPERILVVTRAAYARILQQQTPELPPENFILEPEGRGTAPAIGLAAIDLSKRDSDAVMAVLTADHYIADAAAFQDALSCAEQLARQGYLVTLGIQPVSPSTGYGYIQKGAAIPEQNSHRGYQVKRFVEKPDAENALRMVTCGEYVWNSGMFIWRVDHILHEIAVHMPALYQQLEAVGKVWGTGQFQDSLQAIWSGVTRQTIDYGVMEKASNAAVLPVSMGWVDVGSWSSMDQLHPRDAQGNIWTGPHVAIDTRNSTIITDRDHLTALIGVEGLVIVDTQDALLVCSKAREQEVRELIKHMREMQQTDWL